MEATLCASRTVSNPRRVDVPLRRREDAVLSELIDRYTVHGGLASPDEVIGLMRPYWRQPISILAKWIVDHKVVSFIWRSQILLPMFQFERPRMTPHESVAEAAPQLADLMDDEGVAAWFIRPCEWLRQARPVDFAAIDPVSVADAARRTRQTLMAHRLAD